MKTYNLRLYLYKKKGATGKHQLFRTLFWEIMSRNQSWERPHRWIAPTFTAPRAWHLPLILPSWRYFQQAGFSIPMCLGLGFPWHMAHRRHFKVVQTSMLTWRGVAPPWDLPSDRWCHPWLDRASDNSALSQTLKLTFMIILIPSPHHRPSFPPTDLPYPPGLCLQMVKEGPKLFCPLDWLAHRKQAYHLSWFEYIV